MIQQTPATLKIRDENLVELGFARFLDKRGNEIAVDEPFILLAAAREFQDNYVRFSLEGFVNKGLLHPEGRGFRFERYIAYCLSCAFDEKTPLCDTFNFGDCVPDWAKETAQLVHVSWNEQGIEAYRFHFPDWSGSIATIGCKCDNYDSTEQWFRQPSSLMCYPDKNMGPDIILFVRLASGKIICIMIQCKWSSTAFLSAQVQNEAEASVDPSIIWNSKVWDRIISFGAFFFNYLCRIV